MISQNSLSAAYPLVDRIENCGKVARPLSGTPLETLVNAKPPVYVADVAGVPENSDGTIEGSSVNCCDTEEHREALQLTVDLAASGVQIALHNAKNVVNPLIVQMVDKYEAYVSNAVIDKSAVVSVQPTFYHSIWTNPTILSMTEKYDGSPVMKTPLTVKFPVKTVEELREIVVTGSDRFDRELLEYIDRINVEYNKDMLSYVYQTVFSFESMEGISELDRLINPFTGNMDAGILVFLLASKMYNAVPDGMLLSLAEYKAYLIGIIEQSGRVICRVLQKQESEAKNKTLINYYPSSPFGSPYSDGIIRVNGVVYNQWLAEGGQPEVLFGAYASDTERGYTALLAGKDQYLKIWDREKKILESKIRIDMADIKMTAVRNAFYDIIKELPDEQRVTTNIEMTTTVDRMLKHVDIHSLDNIYYLVRKMICRGIFPNTPAEVILGAIDAVMTANPNMDEREAALLATIDYVGSWAASQIKCELY